jgi:hypothetical protein
MKRSWLLVHDNACLSFGRSSEVVPGKLQQSKDQQPNIVFSGDQPRQLV